MHNNQIKGYIMIMFEIIGLFYRGDHKFWPGKNNQIPDFVCTLVKKLF